MLSQKNTHHLYTMAVRTTQMSVRHALGRDEMSSSRWFCSIFSTLSQERGAFDGLMGGSSDRDVLAAVGMGMAEGSAEAVWLPSAPRPSSGGGWVGAQQLLALR